MEEKALETIEEMRKVAQELKLAGFIDCNKIAEVAEDGIHFDAEESAKIGKYTANLIAKVLGIE